MELEITNQRQFFIDLDKFANSIDLDVVTVQKKLALDIFADVVAGTPVDTGRAMNNWNISVEVPDRTVVQTGGSEQAIQTIKQAAALGEVSKLEPFQTIWISNSLDYIQFLEEGSSDQAPNGWVEQSLRNNLLVLESL